MSRSGRKNTTFSTASAADWRSSGTSTRRGPSSDATTTSSGPASKTLPTRRATTAFTSSSLEMV